jgi:hypothetical protein
MKNKRFFAAVLFAAISTALFAQVRPQHFNVENEPASKQHYTQSVNYEFGNPQKGEFFRSFANPNIPLPDDGLWKNAQASNDQVYLCDSVFIYLSLGLRSKTTYIRDAEGKLLTELLRSISESGEWENVNRSNYSYGSSGELLTFTTQKWLSDYEFWLNESKESYTYNSAGSRLSRLLQQWVANWENRYKYSYTYDSEENLLSDVLQSWNSESSSWENIYKNIYTYDASQNLLSHIKQNWDTENIAWINYRKFSYIYDASDYIVTDLSLAWSIGDSSWVDMSENNYTYDLSGKRLSHIYKAWITEYGDWLNLEKHIYSYDASGKILSDLFQTWTIGIDDWKDHSRYSYSYDDSGNLLLNLFAYWNPDSTNWRNKIKMDYEYDYDAQKVTGNHYTWLAQQWIPIEGLITLSVFDNLLYTSYNNRKAEAYYSSYLSGIGDDAGHAEVSNSFCSPNPAKDLVTVSNPFGNEANLKIFNVSGKQVKAMQLGTGQNQISIQNFAPGIYLFVIQSGNSMIQNKVVVY